MKKIISLVVMFMCSLLVFAGCGYEGGTQAKGVAFTSSVYYVDENVPFQLDYRVFPATANTNNLYVVFESHDTVNYGKYTLDSSSGVITVTDAGVGSDKFKPMEVAVVCGNYSDICTVVLKDYPESVRFESQNIDLVAGTLTELSVLGEFASGEDRIDPSFYNIKIESSNPSVVSVEDWSNFLIKSTGKSGSATITCTFYNSDNKKIQGLDCQTTVNIVSNVEDAVVTLDNHFIRDFSRVINITANVGAKCDLTPMFLDQNGFIVEDKTYTIISLNKEVIEVQNVGGVSKLTIVGGGEAKIVIASNVYDANGNLVTFTLNINVTIST